MPTLAEGGGGAGAGGPVCDSVRLRATAHRQRWTSAISTPPFHIFLSAVTSFMLLVTPSLRPLFGFSLFSSCFQRCDSAPHGPPLSLPLPNAPSLSVLHPGSSTGHPGPTTHTHTHTDTELVPPLPLPLQHPPQDLGNAGSVPPLLVPVHLRMRALSPRQRRGECQEWGREVREERRQEREG